MPPVTASDTRAVTKRLFNKDVTLWSPAERDPGVAAEIAQRLGWLDVFEWLSDAAATLSMWAGQVAASNRFDRTIVLGMGGSSLAPLVLSKLFSPRKGYPVMTILDSTSPSMVRGVLDGDIGRTLFIVASKSGTTLETMDLYRFFANELANRGVAPGTNFVAVTDQGSWLEQHANEIGFAKVFLNPPDIGGRYSALSYFGMVPAALHGVDVEDLVSRAKTYSRTILDGSDQHAVRLGINMANELNNGRDKLMLLLAPELSDLGTWIEQLVAESTGKEGTGILPVCAGPDPVTTPDAYRISIKMGAVDVVDDNNWYVDAPIGIGAEFFRWECATAVASSCLGINPFDQPNVAEAKRSTERFIAGQGVNPELNRIEHPSFIIETTGQETCSVSLPVQPAAGNYFAVLAFLPIERTIHAECERLVAFVNQRFGIQGTIGFGPRYLHSTGQLHKGGKRDGIFLILSDADDSTSIPVPGRAYSFFELIDAQANGDQAVLVERGLPVMRVRLKGDRLESLRAFTAAFLNHGRTI